MSENNRCENNQTTLDSIKTKCINDPKCSGFSWATGNPLPSNGRGCRKNNLDNEEIINKWDHTQQYIRCDCMLIFVFLAFTIANMFEKLDTMCNIEDLVGNWTFVESKFLSQSKLFQLFQ